MGSHPQSLVDMYHHIGKAMGYYHRATNDWDPLIYPPLFYRMRELKKHMEEEWVNLVMREKRQKNFS